MGWILRLVETGTDGQPRSADVMEFSRPDGFDDISNLGLTLPEAKQLLARVQQGIVAAQAHKHAVLRPECRSCGGRCHVKDWRFHQIATLFGGMTVRLPRFRCAGCGRIEKGVSWPSHCRSTPELVRLQAHLSALMTYRVAAGVLKHTLKTGEQLHNGAVVTPPAAASAVAVTLDATFIRSRDDGQRHLEVRVGNVETDTGGRQVFGAVARSGTDITALIRRNLETVGRTDDTALTAFTDGCPSLRSSLADAGITKPPILDWFHIAMRLQHAKQAASGLSTEVPPRVQAKTVIVEEVERLRWRIWSVLQEAHGKGVQHELTGRVDKLRER